MLDTPLTVDVALTGPIALEHTLASIPADASVKGLFFRRFAELLGPEYARLAGALAAPAKDGKYVAFRDYPQRDYAQVVVAAGRKRFPALSPREALRRVAREDLQIFATSMIGKVVLTVTGDAGSTLLRVPDAYKAVAPYAEVRAVTRDPRTIRVTFAPHLGFVEYTLGQLEGVVLAFQRAPITIIRALPPSGYAFDVVHAV